MANMLLLPRTATWCPDRTRTATPKSSGHAFCRVEASPSSRLPTQQRGLSINRDGTRIAFISPNNGQVRVFDTQLGIELTATVGTALNPALSGDGTVVAYAKGQQLYTLAYRLTKLTLAKTATPGVIRQDQL